MITKCYELSYDTTTKSSVISMKLSDSSYIADFLFRLNKNGFPIDLRDSVATIAVIKPNGNVDAQFIELDDTFASIDLNLTLKDLDGVYKGFLVLSVKEKFYILGPLKYQISRARALTQLVNESFNDNKLFNEILLKLEPIVLTMEQDGLDATEYRKSLDLLKQSRNSKNMETTEEDVEIPPISSVDETIRQNNEVTRQNNENLRKSNEVQRERNELSRRATEDDRIRNESIRQHMEDLRKIAENEREIAIQEIYDYISNLESLIIDNAVAIAMLELTK